MKLNIARLIINTLIMASVISCDSQIESTSPGVFDDGTKKLELDLHFKDQIRLWCNTVCSFEAKMDGEYSVEVHDQSIAKVKIEGNKFTVKTLNPGITDITITEKKSSNSTTIKCYSRSFSGVWAESPELIYCYKNSVVVVAEDNNIAEKIRSELKPISLNRGYEFTFSEKTNDLLVLIPTQGDPKKGTYSWDIKNRTLSINYLNKSEIYKCDIQPEYPNFFVNTPRFIMALSQDLTNEYIDKYPNSGISEVQIIRHIISLSDYWMILRDK